MLTDDLVGGIALDALRARVPVADDAVGIEHEHGVVADALDQQLEPTLRLLPLFGLGNEPGIGGGEFDGALADPALEALLALAQRRLDPAPAPDFLLRGPVQSGFVDGDGSLAGNGPDDAFRPLVEHTRLRMPEEQAAQHLAGASHHGHRQINSAPANGPTASHDRVHSCRSGGRW